MSSCLQADDEMADVEEHLLQRADEKQESLKAERDIDPLAGEQSHITEEELEEAEGLCSIGCFSSLSMSLTKAF